MKGKNLLLLGLLLLPFSLVLATSVAQTALHASRGGQGGGAQSREAGSQSSPTPRLVARVAAPTPQPRAAAASARPIPPNPRIAARLPMVDHPDIQPTHQAILEEVLRLLEPPCLGNIENVYVRYDKQPERGLSGKHTIILTGLVPDDEFRALAFHELGHAIDLGCNEGTAASGASAFKDGKEVIFADDPSAGFYEISWAHESVQKKGATASDFVSGYARSDCFEDFAETFAYFMLHNENFTLRAQTNKALAAKLQWMETNVPLVRIDVAAGRETWNGRIPWDITKLPYAWLPQTELAAQ